MSTVVVNNSSPTRIISSSKPQQPANILIKKLDSTLKLQQISNVNSENLADGSVLVYDSATNQFIFSTVGTSIGSVDGGTY